MLTNQLAELKLVVLGLKRGTPLPELSQNWTERNELATIHKTLNVVLAEIDKLDTPQESPG